MANVRGIKVGAIPTNTVIAVASPSGSKTDANAQVLRYYKTADGVYRDAKGTVMIKAVNPQKGLGTTQFIAVPVANSGVTTTTSTTPAKMSPFKTEPTILPKTVHLQNTPVILNSQQRAIPSIAQMIGSSPKTSYSDQSSWSGKRSLDLDDYNDPKRNRRNSTGIGGSGGGSVSLANNGDKGGKGLRHFSMKVCEKVQKKGTTSYNEVADELVAEFTLQSHRAGSSSCDQAYDQKNIRRRVYDALNVLMAMNIISKEKKEIKWLGLPTNSAQECQNLEIEKSKRLERLRLKNQQLHDLILQQIAFKNLVERNKSLDKQSQPALNSAIQLPFIIVNTNKKTVIDCSISSDKSEYLFTFDNTFEIHDDIEVLKRMGLAFDLDKGTCTPENLEKARKMVPKALEPYVIQMANGGGDLPPGMTLSAAARPDRPRGTSTSSGMEGELDSAHFSRQSSIGSSSHSRAESSSESEDDYSDSDSEPGASSGGE